jgi:hypothetical protein
MERHDAMMFGMTNATAGGDNSLIERRVTIGGGGGASRAEVAPGTPIEPRLGQERRRASGPRTMRTIDSGAAGLR